MLHNAEFAGTPLSAALTAREVGFCEGFLVSLEQHNFPKATVLAEDAASNYEWLVKKVPRIPLPRFFKTPKLQRNWAMPAYPVGIIKGSLQQIVDCPDGRSRMRLPEQVYLCADRTLRLGAVLVNDMGCVLNPTDLQKNNPGEAIPEVVLGKVFVDQPPLPDPPVIGGWWIPPHDNMRVWMPPHWCTFQEMDVCNALNAAIV